MSFGTAALHGNELYHCFAWCHFLTEARLLLVAWNVFYLSQEYDHPSSKEINKLLCSQCPPYTALMYWSFRNFIQKSYMCYRTLCSCISTSELIYLKLLLLRALHYYDNMYSPTNNFLHKPCNVLSINVPTFRRPKERSLTCRKLCRMLGFKRSNPERKFLPTRGVK